MKYLTFTMMTLCLSVQAFSCTYDIDSKLEISSDEISIFKSKVTKTLEQKYQGTVQSIKEDFDLDDITPYITKTTLVAAGFARAASSTMGEAAAECEYYSTMDNLEHAKVYNVIVKTESKTCSQKVSLTKRFKAPFFSKIQNLRRYFETDCN